MIEIENIFKNGNNKEKELVEKIIYQRKKYNIKKKQKELRKIQEEIEMQKKFKTIFQFFYINLMFVIFVFFH